MEGEIGLVDRIDAVATDTMKIKTLITNNNFINEDIIYLIWTMNRNTTPKSIKDVLKWVCDNYISDTNNELVNNFIEECVKYTYFLLRNKIHNAKNKDISAIINELKNLYLSTRNEDADLLLLRDLGGEIINKAKGKNISKSLYLSSRTALILYISLMTLTA
jgi:hypothetical protein